MLAKATTPKQRYWLNHVKVADQGGDTIAGYAQSLDISLKSLYQWKTKLIRLKLYSPVASSKSEFVPVKQSPVPIKWPHELPLDCVQLTAQQVAWLIGGYDLTLMQGHSRLPHHTVL